jgi:subtilisin-like proprotein convertase family protein/cytochrome c553
MKRSRAQGFGTLLLAGLLVPACSGGGNGGNGGGPSQASVPDLTGQGLLEARAALLDAGLDIGTLQTEQRPPPPQKPLIRDPAVMVLSQSVPAGTLVDPGTTIGVVVSRPEDADRFLISLDAAPVPDDAGVASAYYDAIDPGRLKRSLADWLAQNQFGSPGGDETEATYGNDADLGFGRHMHMRRNGTSIAYYVENYPSVGEAVTRSNYLATVAMEFGPGPAGTDPTASYTRFFAYGPDGGVIQEIDLDGRGKKGIPGVCVPCHGGTALQPPSGASYPNAGDVHANFIPFDLRLLEFASQTQLSRSAQEDAFRELNRGVRDTFSRRFVYSGPAVDIPDNDPLGVEIPITVPQLDQVFNRIGVSFPDDGLEHPALEQLEISIVSPDGRSSLLLSQPVIPGGAVRIGTADFPATGSKQAMDTDPAGELYVAAGADIVHVPNQGDAGIVATFPAPVRVLRRSPLSGTLYALTGSLYEVTPGVGSPRELQGAYVFCCTDLRFDSQGRIITSSVVRDVARWNPTDGSSTYLLAAPNTNSYIMSDFALDTDGDIVWTETSDTNIFVHELATFSDQFDDNDIVPVDSGQLTTEGSPITLVEVIGPRTYIALTDPPNVPSEELLWFGSDDVLHQATSGCSFAQALTVDPAGGLIALCATDDSATRFAPYRIENPGGRNLQGTLFVDSASASIDGQPGSQSPFNDSYLPKESLAKFELQNPAGTWKLRIVDRVPGGTGRLHSFALTFTQRADLRDRYEAARLVEGWYGGPDLPGAFNEDFVPPEWQPPIAPPEAVELYTKVVARSCRLCHGQLLPWLDFSSYDQFVGLADLHRQLVFQEGRMPLSLRAFNRFWFSARPGNQPTTPFSSTYYSGPADPTSYPDQPSILARFIPSIPEAEKRWGPGRPVARTSGDITASAGVPTSLDGTNTIFANSFLWTQVSGPPVSLQNAGTSLASFVAPSSNSPYDLAFQLAVSDEQSSSVTTVNAHVVASGHAVTYSDVAQIWTSKCATCHGATAAGNLDLTASGTCANLKTANALGTCASLLLVRAGDPDNSALYRRLTGGACGAQMPEGSPPLLSSEVTLVHDWIASGAPCN